MQGGGDIRHIGGGEIIIALAAILLLAAPLAGGSGKPSAAKALKPDYESPIPIPPGAFPAKDSGMARATIADPFMVRDYYIAAPEPLVRFFIENPRLAFKIAREMLGTPPLRLERDEDDGQWTLRGAESKYIIIPPAGNGAAGVAGFGIRIENPIAFLRDPRARKEGIAGHGVLTVRARPGDDAGETIIDYDLRVAGEGSGLGGVMALYLRQAAAKDAKSLLAAFKEVCEGAADDPASLAEDMELEEDIFTAEELKRFRGRFVSK
jgi:hypothetical protein